MNPSFIRFEGNEELIRKYSRFIRIPEFMDRSVTIVLKRLPDGGMPRTLTRWEGESRMVVEMSSPESGWDTAPINECLDIAFRPKEWYEKHRENTKMDYLLRKPRKK